MQLEAGALIVSQKLFFESQRAQIVRLAARHAVPTIYGSRAFPIEGGLISYGADLTDAYRQIVTFVSRILKGEKTADLPVQQASKIEFIINLKTATIPLALRTLRTITESLSVSVRPSDSGRKDSDFGRTVVARMA